MPRVVLSSCVADSGWAAQYLASALARTYGARKVVAIGGVADPALRYASLSQAEIVLVVIGPYWLRALTTTPEGALIRAELTALLHDFRPRLILPVLIAGAMMPLAGETPPDLQPILYLQAATVPTHAGQVYDIHQVIKSITDYRANVRAKQRASGNYTWFKIVSAVPTASFVVFGVADVTIFGGPTDQLTATQNLLGFLLALIMFLSIFGVWLTVIIVAAVSRRTRWAIANAASIPLAIAALLVLVPLATSLPPGAIAIQIIFVIVTVLLLFGALFALPVIFAMTLPPHRHKSNVGERP